MPPLQHGGLAGTSKVNPRTDFVWERLTGVINDPAIVKVQVILDK